MKKSILLILSIMFCISLSSQRNPSAEYWISYTYNPKKGMTEEFEKAVAEKTKKFNSSEENAFFTFQTLTGNQQGAYQRWQVRKSVGYFDEDRKKEGKYWNDNVDPMIAEKSGQIIWMRLKGASHGWDESRMPDKFYTQETVVIKRGKNQDFLKFHRRFTELMSEIEWTGNRGMFKLSNGGNVQTYMLIHGFNEHSWMSYSTNLEEGTNWVEVYDEKFGENAWAEDRELANSAIESWGATSRKLEFRPDLSSKL